jgi:tetratricopeptide (TPR) repeat protein
LSLDWNWAEAEREYLRAFELNPSAAGSSTGYAIFLASMGRREEAVARADGAVELAPLDLSIRTGRALVELLVGLPERALSDTAWFLEIDPGYVVAFVMDALAKQALGRYEDAALAYHRFDERMPPEMQLYTGLEQAWREGGSSGYRDSMRRDSTNRGSFMRSAIACVGSGDADAAFEMLEKAYATRGSGMMYLLTPWFAPLHKSPRFADLARRMNLPVPEDATTH